MSNNTQLTPAIGYDTKSMIFSEPQSGSIPGSTITFKRILIQTKNPDGTVGDLIIPTTKVFSFGPSESRDLATQKLNGYVMPLCLYTRDNPQKEEVNWVESFNNIVEECKKHLVTEETKRKIEKYDLEYVELKKMNPLYYKREKGKIVPGTGPTLYAKLIRSKKLNKIITMFYNFDGEEINPLDNIGKYCFAKAAIKIESIFVGSKITLQVKLYECEMRLIEMGMPRLLRPNAKKRVLTSKQSCPLLSESKDGEEQLSDDAGEGSLAEDSDDSDVVTSPKVVVRKKKTSTLVKDKPATTKVVRKRRVKKVVARAAT
jgi:hypothetical protein